MEMEMEWNSNLLHSSIHWTVRFGSWTQPSQNKITQPVEKSVYVKLIQRPAVFSHPRREDVHVLVRTEYVRKKKARRATL